MVTCHDLLAIRAARGEVPGRRTGWTGRLFQRMILRGLRRAGRMACVSSATRSEAERLIGSSAVIPNAVDEHWRPMDRAAAREQLGRTEGYVMHVGGDQWYKNRAGAVRAFIELRKRHTAAELVLVGPRLEPALERELEKAGLARAVTVLSGVPDETLRALYSLAGVLIFPSLSEGFGWPIIEAQACGCPVVTTDREPMRETGGAGAIYAAEGEWAKCAAQVLEMDRAHRAALVAAGIENARRFTVRNMARQYLEFYRGR